MGDLKSIQGGKTDQCEVVKAFLELTRELRADGCDEEFIKAAMGNLAAVYVAIYSPSQLVYSE